MSFVSFFKEHSINLTIIKEHWEKDKSKMTEILVTQSKYPKSLLSHI